MYLWFIWQNVVQSGDGGRGARAGRLQQGSSGAAGLLPTLFCTSKALHYVLDESSVKSVKSVRLEEGGGSGSMRPMTQQQSHRKLIFTLALNYTKIDQASGEVLGALHKHITAAN